MLPCMCGITIYKHNTHNFNCFDKKTLHFSQKIKVYESVAVKIKHLLPKWDSKRCSKESTERFSNHAKSILTQYPIIYRT